MVLCGMNMLMGQASNVDEIEEKDVRIVGYGPPPEEEKSAE